MPPRANQQPRIFTVIGHGKFPIDMLRYNACFPYQSGDSTKIAHSIKFAEERNEYKINLCQPAGYSPPNIERWRSFGWEVTDFR
jgi:hypothetical protein